MTKKLIALILVIFCSIIILVNRKSQTKFIASDEENSFIAAYIDGEISKTLPGKDDGYIVEKIECNNDIGATWDNTNWGVLFTGNIQSTKCNVYFKKIVTHEFDYTGSEQVFTADATGIYKLETWGAQGNSTTGAYGAYSTGTISLNKGDKLYINVGGTTTTTVGGYNGGGTGNHGGGGATHIATTSGLLSTLSSKKDKILIVSGGGGGAGQAGAGGSAGGIQGVRGETGACTNKGGYGGTQTAGGSVVATNWAQVGSFGRGGNAIQNQTGGAGGSGYFGGGSGTSGSCYGGGGGGSSYIGNSLLSDKAMYCYNCTTSTATDTKTVSTSCSETTPTANCAKKGNGYVKITLIN